MKSVYSFCLAFLVLLGFTESVFSQQNCSSNINLQNPSFEGSAGSQSLPSWSSSSCTWGPNVMNNSSSTTQSGTRLSSSPPVAFDGGTYLGMSYNSSQGGQVIWQQLSSPLVAGTTYTTSIELAVATVSTGDDPYKYYWTRTCGGVNVYGGNSPCSTDQLLWSSGQISNTNWQNFQISFTPSQNWAYLIIVSTGCGYDSYNYNQSSITFVDTIAPLVTNFNLTAQADRNNLCALDSAGQATVHVTSGPAPTGFQWNTNPVQTDSVIKNVPAGTYTVTVTTGNALCATASVTISSPPALTANAAATTTDCFTNGHGVINAAASGGIGPYQFLWNNGNSSSTASNLFSGVYKVTISDAHYCTAVASVTIDSAAPINVTAYVKPAACPAYSNGYITADQTGGTPGFKYLWNTTPAQSGMTAYNLTQGSYTVTVTDNHNCSSAGTFSVGQSAPSDNLAVINAVPCNGHIINGSISTSVSGGTGPYSYEWSSNPPQTTSVAINLAPGSYTVTVTDNLGCSTVDNATITSSDAMNVNIASSSSTCGNTSDAFAAANVSGGTGPVTYHWSTGASTDTISNISAGTYRVTVTSHNGCSTTASAIVNPTHSDQVVNVTSAITTMCSGDNAYICATPGFAHYHWNTSDTTPCIYTQFAGNFYLTVTDQNNCTTESNHLAIHVYPNPPIAISGNGNILTVHGVDSAQWYKNGSIIPNATDSVYIAPDAGAYTVYISDDNGCHQISSPYDYLTNGINGLSENTWVKVYPNPSTSGSWQLQVGDNMLGSTIEVYDDNGRMIYQSEIKSLNSALELDVAKGIYIMKVLSPYKNFNVKLTRL